MTRPLPARHLFTMTPTRTLVCVMIALAACAGLYMEWRALDRTIAQQAGTIAALQAKIAHSTRAEHQPGEHLIGGRRAESTEGRAEPASAVVKSRTPALFGPQSRIQRLLRVSHYLEQHPELGIPELRLINDDAWDQIVEGNPVKTEAEVREALAWARFCAEQQSGPMIVKALSRHLEAHGERSPTGISALGPYLADPSYAGFFSSFGLYDGTANNPAPGGDKWVLQGKSVDPSFDMPLCIGANGSIGSFERPPDRMIEDAVAKFRNATGANPSDPSQVMPYLTQPVARGLVADVMSAAQRDL